MFYEIEIKKIFRNMGVTCITGWLASSGYRNMCVLCKRTVSTSFCY